MPTPFDINHDLNLEGLKDNVRFMIKHGLKRGNSVLWPMGTVGEAPSLTIKERTQIMKAIMEVADGKIPVIMGVGHTCIREIIDLCNYAENIGADGVMVPPPYYFKSTTNEVYRFFREIVSNTHIGIVSQTKSCL